VSPPPPASSAVDGSGAGPLSPGAAEVPVSPLPPQVAPQLGDILSDAEIERRVDVALGPLYPPPPPAPYMDGAPGASLWNPDIDVVSVDTIHPQDMPLTADVLSLSCVLAQRTRDISHRYAENTHDTFIAKPSQLSEDNTLPVQYFTLSQVFRTDSARTTWIPRIPCRFQPYQQRCTRIPC
jgi:hypothetical protein